MGNLLGSSRKIKFRRIRPLINAKAVNLKKYYYSINENETKFDIDGWAKFPLYKPEPNKALMCRDCWGETQLAAWKKWFWEFGGDGFRRIGNVKEWKYL